MEEILTFLSQSPGLEASQDKHVLVLGDSTEISLKKQKDSLEDIAQVGFLSDNKTPGFFAHVNMAIDAEDGQGYCLSDVQLWNRLKRHQKHQQENDTRSASEKESDKWIQGLERSVALLKNTRHRTFVFDQEADIERLFLYPRDTQTDLLVRTHYNRSILVEGEAMFLEDYLERLDSIGSYQINIREVKRKNVSRRKLSPRKARKAEMRIKIGAFEWKKKGISQTYWVVEAAEIPESVPENEDRIYWRLLTSHRVDSLEEAQKIIHWYKQRWMIEQLFRILKKQGINLEGSELKYASSIQKLCAMGLFAAFDVMRLVLARDNPIAQPCKDVFTPEQRECLGILSQKLEGKTQKQKNPFPPKTLSWATWIIARLGGWKGYKSQRPPGPITIKNGLTKFHTFFEAWIIFSSE
ncbi:MAG: IS4 family transposase [Ekhidna sp.]|nr:IS4 family transposase [Ekhidna sp.]